LKLRFKKLHTELNFEYLK